MAIPPKIGGTLFEVICEAGALRASISIFSRLAQPPVVGVVMVVVIIVVVVVELVGGVVVIVGEVLVGVGEGAVSFFEASLTSTVIASQSISRTCCLGVWTEMVGAWLGCCPNVL